MKLRKILTLTLALLLFAGASLSLSSCGSSAPMLPIVCGETGMTNLCGVATYGVNYYNLGVMAGDMAADILLEGKKPADIPVAIDDNPALSINETVAEEIGFTIPDAVKAKAEGGEAETVTRNTDAIVAEGGDFTVGILQLVQHVALDQSNQGFQDQLSVRMAAANKTVTIQDKNANNDASTNTTIANGFINDGVDLIYAIATSSSQAAMEAAKDTQTPVLFNAVTDPKGAGLVASLEKPGSYVTGVSDINPVAEQVALIGELLNKDNVTVGFLYSSGETNSVYQVELGIAKCEELGFSYVDKGIAAAADLQSAMVALQEAGVDAIYIPTDNTLANICDTVHATNMGQ